jgi:hypothetical protein
MSDSVRSGSLRVSFATNTSLVFLARGTGFAATKAMIDEQLRLTAVSALSSCGVDPRRITVDAHGN